jgi:hypothetical protein
MDGTLVLWGLGGQAYPEYIRKALLEERFLPAMERLRQLATERTLAVAAHISLPRGTDVVNAVRISRDVCRHEQVNCDLHCGGMQRGQRNCDVVAGVTDADLFSAVLQPAERSALYHSTSSIVDAYGPHAVRFCYVHLGEEVARLEVPVWTDPEALDFAHAALVAQAAKGHSYPLALQEAHEQAVVNGADRDRFAQLVRETLAGGRLPLEEAARELVTVVDWHQSASSANSSPFCFASLCLPPLRFPSPPLQHRGPTAGREYSKLGAGCQPA